MRVHFFLALILTAMLSANAGEQFPVIRVGSETYSNVTVTSVSATDIYFTYAGGMANAKIKDLSPDLQKHFHFDPKKAKEVELQQAENNARYHEELIHQPPPSRESPDDTARVPTALWRNDLPGALKQAQSDHKLVLLDFTGSDWCPWCMKFDHEVLSTSRFAAYAQNKLVLVKVDFPRHTLQDAKLRKANETLAKRFNVDSFPTYILLNSDGKELGRQEGYVSGGPDAFIKELDGFSRH